MNYASAEGNLDTTNVQLIANSQAATLASCLWRKKNCNRRAETRRGLDSSLRPARTMREAPQLLRDRFNNDSGLEKSGELKPKEATHPGRADSGQLD